MQSPFELIPLPDPGRAGAREPQIGVQKILQTLQSWDGINYKSYPATNGQERL
jgi:hypothetical protein